MTISVVVPTFRRPLALCRCLHALARQILLPDEVLVVTREEDLETRTLVLVRAWPELSLRFITVSSPGQVAALNAGLDAAAGEIVAITDDDAAPRPDWLARLHAHFITNPHLGGIGGRDWVHQRGHREDGVAYTVGRVCWFGRIVGNHHLGGGSARPADVLKGANMSFRRTALAGVRFDERLRGTGAQVHNDMAFCLAVRRKGVSLLYDPSVAVDHFPAPRFDQDQREVFHAAAHRDAVHNETLVLLTSLPLLRQFVCLTYALVVGTRQTPGLLLALFLMLRREKMLAIRVAATAQGRVAGWLTFCNSRRNI